MINFYALITEKFDGMFLYRICNYLRHSRIWIWKINNTETEMYSLFFVEHLLYCGVRSGSVKKILDPDKNKRTLSAALWLYQYKNIFVHKTFTCSTLSQSSNKNAFNPQKMPKVLANQPGRLFFFLHFILESGPDPTTDDGYFIRS